MAEVSELDTTGLLCPLPVLKIRKRMKRLALGDILRVRSDDPAAAIDIPHYCNEQGQKIVNKSEQSGVLEFVIRKSK